MRATAFPEDWYAPWCRLYLGVRNHATGLTDWLARQPFLSAAHCPKLTRQALNSALHSLASASPNGRQLAAAHACLHALERRYTADAQSANVGAALKEIKVDGRRYVLLRPLRQSLRPPPDSLDRFPLSSELATDQVLKLDFRWLELQEEARLELKVLADLDALRDEITIRFGLAPLASSDDMDWSGDPTDARQPDGRVPVRCCGAKKAENLGQTLEELLRAAWEAKVHILLLPELVVDEPLLQRCRNWLAHHNLREVRLRLVVAGSQHVADAEGGKDFFNRSTVLGYDGELLWQQDKCSPFVIDNPVALAALCPSSQITKLFEPTRLGVNIVLAEAALGRLLTPICLDYIEGILWDELGADIYLVPAMTEGLSRFKQQANTLGGRHGAASFVCNAQTSGEDRIVSYLPFKRAPSPHPTASPSLFTIDARICV